MEKRYLIAHMKRSGDDYLPDVIVVLEITSELIDRAGKMIGAARRCSKDIDGWAKVQTGNLAATYVFEDWDENLEGWGDLVVTEEKLNTLIDSGQLQARLENDTLDLYPFADQDAIFTLSDEQGRESGSIAYAELNPAPEKESE